MSVCGGSCLVLLALAYAQSDAIYFKSAYVANQLPGLQNKMNSIQGTVNAITNQLIMMASASASGGSLQLVTGERLSQQNNAIMNGVQIIQRNVTRLTNAFVRLVNLLQEIENNRT